MDVSRWARVKVERQAKEGRWRDLVIVRDEPPCCWMPPDADFKT